MIITTQNGQVVQPGDHIVVAENFPSMAMSQWFIAVSKPAASYDSPYDPIIFMPKSGRVAGPEHDERHEQTRQLAELFAQTIRDQLTASKAVIQG